MSKIRVAIVGVGNCASSLVQGVTYYHDADPSERVPGLMHVQFGDYHISDIEFVAAFDVDAAKVGLDLADAINASDNCTIKISDVAPTGVRVQRGETLETGVGKAGPHHQPCRSQKQAPTIPPGAHDTDAQRHERRAHERGRGQHAHLPGRKPERKKIRGQDHGDQPLAEIAQRPGRENGADRPPCP